MRLYAGTSGYSYKEWKGTFYPEDLPAGEMLRTYASLLPSVEINNTFYRLPSASVLASWAEQVPAEFRFVLKASQRITHTKRLREAEDETAYLLHTADALAARLGGFLFQLPPNLKKDLPRLEAFLRCLPDGTRAAFEFRHPTWFTDDVFDALRARACALCIADTGEDTDAPFVATASWGYLRLRREDYVDADLRSWAERVRGTGWDDAFVFFKHEDGGTGPRWARQFLTLCSD